MARIFSPSNSALVLIDHQFGTMQLIKNLPLEQVKRNTLALARAAQILKIPAVITSSQEDRLQNTMLPDLREFLPEAFAARVKRLGVVNAWDDPAFKSAVENLGRRNLIMAGVTTDVCLVYPAITAMEMGYQVQAVMDASGSPFELSEALAQQRMRDAGVVLTATNTMIAELGYDWSRPGGMELLELLFTKVLPPIKPAA
jgi:nicotinamidase-related amidase